MGEPAKVADGEALPLLMKWRQTWPDREADYIASTPNYDGPIGRIYLNEHEPHKGKWLWAMNAYGPEISRNISDLHGIEPSARAAAYMVEDAWFRAIAGSSLEGPIQTRSSFEMVKTGE